MSEKDSASEIEEEVINFGMRVKFSDKKSKGFSMIIDKTKFPLFFTTSGVIEEFTTLLVLKLFEKHKVDNKISSINIKKIDGLSIRQSFSFKKDELISKYEFIFPDNFEYNLEDIMEDFKNMINSKFHDLNTGMENEGN